MGIFSQHVMEYQKLGLLVIPCGERKNPLLGLDWAKRCETKASDEQIDQWIKKFDQAPMLGLVTGKANGLVAFDFDYEYDEKKCKISKKDFDKDRKNIELQIIALLPPTPLIKTGKKGWTRLYKWHESLDENSNVQLDRNNVRLFDFLSWHKQTIVPPSKHSLDSEGNPIIYKWLGPEPADCLDDVPEITLDNVLEIKSIFDEATSEPDNSRHGKLFRWALINSRIEKDLKTLALAMVQADKEMNGDKPYLSDKKYDRSGDAYKHAEKWLTKIIKWQKIKGDKVTSEDIKFFNPHDLYFAFFKKNLGEHRIDIVTNKFLFKSGNEWKPVFNRIASLRSEAMLAKLDRSMVEDHLYNYAEKTKPKFLFEIPAWDGRDRIKEMLSFVKIKSHDQFVFEDALKEWCANVFRRFYQPSVQNRCIILKGAQNMGKDTWIRSLFGAFSPYYCKFTNSRNDERQIWSQVTDNLIVHLEEFDQTSTLSVPFLKDMITRDFVTYRSAYAREEVTRKCIGSFVSSVNIDAILRDETGNRRFAVFELESIDWKYPKDWSPMILAQCHAYYMMNYRALETTWKSVTEGNAIFEQVDMVPEYLNFWDNELKKSLGFGAKEVGFVAAEPVIAKICKMSGWTMKSVCSMLKTNGRSRHGKSGTMYYCGDSPLYLVKNQASPIIDHLPITVAVTEK